MLSWAFMDQVLNTLWFWALGRGGPVLKSLACSGQTSCAPGRTRDAGLTWLLGVDRLEVVHRLLRHSLWSTWPT